MYIDIDIIYVYLDTYLCQKNAQSVLETPILCRKDPECVLKTGGKVGMGPGRQVVVRHLENSLVCSVHRLNKNNVLAPPSSVKHTRTHCSSVLETPRGVLKTPRGVLEMSRVCSANRWES